MRLNYYRISRRLLELHFRLYFQRNDVDPVEFLIVNETSALVKHKNSWIPVSLIDLLNWFYATT